MSARANSSSGPKADIGPAGSDDESHALAYAMLSGIATGLLFLVSGLLSDSHDTYFNVIVPVSLAGGAIVAFFVWRRGRQTSLAHGPRAHSFESSNFRSKDVW